MRAQSSSSDVSYTALVRRGSTGKLGHEVACRQRPHSGSGRLQRGHQPLSEDRVGRAAPGGCLPHRVGPGWRGAHNGCIRTARPRTVFLTFCVSCFHFGASVCVSVFPCFQFGQGRLRDRVSVFTAWAASCFRRFASAGGIFRHFSSRAPRGMKKYGRVLCFVFPLAERVAGV